MSTGVEWTDETWNPVTGCWPVSPGCAHCYAAPNAARLVNMGAPGVAYVGTVNLDGVGKPLLGSRARWTGTVRCHPDRLDIPRRWKKPRRVFVNSMSDLFHDDVPFEFVDRVFEVMEACPRHTFQVLTKRPERMRVFMLLRYGVPKIVPPSNVWLGVSAENLAKLDSRARVLRATPAGLRFLSCEPLLESLSSDSAPISIMHPWPYGVEERPTLEGIGWVIVGGESGSGARPMKAAWVREIRDACQAASVPFFFKQWGGPGRTAKGRTLDGRTHEEYPPEPWRES